MVSVKQILFIFFFISLAGYLIGLSFQIWAVLIFLYLIISIINIKNSFSSRLPLGELVVLSFFIENVLAVTLIEILNGENLNVGDGYYISVPIMEYLPFAFVTIQSFLIGYYSVAVPGQQWISFINSINKKIEKKELFYLLIIGLGGPLLSLLSISYLNFVSYTLTSFFLCGLIGLMLYTRKITNLYFLGGLALNIMVVIRSGMFGNMVYFLLYSCVMLAMLITSSGKKINWYLTLSAFVVGVLFMAYLQNIKSDYRTQAWQGEGGDEAFINTISENASSADPTEKEFYLPILYRINQGWLVSEVMKKVPVYEPYANGETIITSLVGAITPRALNPDKEEAGGRAKIARFTDKVLVGSTSMNIGILGETYANFGFYGSFVFLFLYGLIVAKFEKYLLNYSVKEPMILVFFPVFFRVLFGSGTDFLMVINTITKAYIIIYFILILLRRTRSPQSTLHSAY